MDDVRKSIKDTLRKFSIFKTLTEQELESIALISTVRWYNQKMMVFMQEEVLDRVFFIQTGKVKVYRTDINGNEQIISILEDGEMFPHVGFFRKGNFPAHAEIIEKSSLIVVPIEDFEGVLLNSPEMCIKLFNVLGEKIVDLQNRLEEQILHNTFEQIVMLLLRLCKTNGVQEENDYRLTTQFTNREFANMIGTSRETVSRTLTQLKKDSFIKTDSEGYYLIDYDKLHSEIL
ncbi:Crp/Fnr family transcriptional regulator [Bacillus sp. BGMRC 2118]|nr:Crp/Fnr family transcriptional regulator [Bacillus sp. BGMRC 2118]